jgi:hypothetical protein
VSLYQLRVVNVVLSREAEPEKRIGLLELMHFDCGLRFRHGKPCLEPLIHVFHVLGKSIVQPAQGDRCVPLVKIFINHCIHKVSAGSHKHDFDRNPEFGKKEISAYCGAPFQMLSSFVRRPAMRQLCVLSRRTGVTFTLAAMIFR